MTPKPHRLSACHRHPTLPITGFCASCLRERLAGFHSPPSPDLRRITSHSGDGDSSEPRRRSYEVRARRSLSDLFFLDDGRRFRNRKPEAESENSGFGIGKEEHGDGNDGAVRVFYDVDEETKTMKEFIDLELHSKKRDSRSFRDAFSGKFRKWKKWKHKLKNNRNGNGNGGSIEKLKRARETQSEIGEYTLGRRSCDMDPRFSISVDCRRASWDGCLIGPCSCSRVENPNDNVSDEEIDNVGSDESNSSRRQSMTGVVDELKLVSNANAKVSPATTELFHGAKLLVDEKDLNLRDANLKSSSSYVHSDCVIGSASKAVRQKGFKKLHKWGVVWNKLGLVQRRQDKMGEAECVVGDKVDKPLRRVVNVGASESISQKLIRSCSVSSRNPCRMAGLVNSLGSPETKGNNVLDGKQEYMLQRNRSVRYSPNNVYTGLLRFYLTPLRSYRRSKSVKNSIIKDLHPIC